MSLSHCRECIELLIVCATAKEAVKEVCVPPHRFTMRSGRSRMRSTACATSHRDLPRSLRHGARDLYLVISSAVNSHPGHDGPSGGNSVNMRVEKAQLAVGPSLLGLVARLVVGLW
jgi:hypothetical protein